MQTLSVTAVRPSAPRFLINGLIPENATTLISGGTSLQREGLLADIAFSINFDASFHGRRIMPHGKPVLVYLGDAEKLAHFLWAWNMARDNLEKDSQIRCFRPLSFDQFSSFLQDMLAENSCMVLFVESIDFPEDYATNPIEIHKLLEKCREAGCNLSVIFVGGEYPTKALGAKVHTLINLEKGPEDTIIVEVIRSALNDLPLRFPLVRSHVDSVLVYQNSHILDQAMYVIFEVRRAGKSKKLRVIDALSAIYCAPDWPTDELLGNMLSVSALESNRIFNKLQNMKYLDLETLNITELGLEALRTHNPAIMATF